jgi:hypothetical protein
VYSILDWPPFSCTTTERLVILFHWTTGSRVFRGKLLAGLNQLPLQDKLRNSTVRAGSPLQISVMRFLRPPTTNWLDYGRTAAQQREACCDSKGCNDCFQYLQGTPLNLRKCANRDSLGRLPPGPEDYEICTTVTIWMVTHELSVVFPRYLCAESHRRRVILHARSDQKCMQRV